MGLSTKPINLQVELPQLGDPTAGGGSWPLQTDRVENWAWLNGIFNDAELDAIINLGESYEEQRGATGGGNRLEVRDSYVAFMFPNEATNWIYRRLTDAIQHVNHNFFGFDLTEMGQGLQFTKYKAPSGHYDWHIDRGMAHGTRKLSLTLQLSKPDDYEGGDLELFYGGKLDGENSEVVKASRDRGMATFFPSYVLHRVTPVTSGTRYSLVAWISGPSFK
jgi:PKHD-type hydroxylase